MCVFACLSVLMDTDLTVGHEARRKRYIALFIASPLPPSSLSCNGVCIHDGKVEVGETTGKKGEEGETLTCLFLKAGSVETGASSPACLHHAPLPLSHFLRLFFMNPLLLPPYLYTLPPSARTTNRHHSSIAGLQRQAQQPQARMSTRTREKRMGSG